MQSRKKATYTNIHSMKCGRENFSTQTAKMYKIYEDNIQMTVEPQLTKIKWSRKEIIQRETIEDWANV